MDNRSDTTRWGKFSDAAEADLNQYRALSGLAVVGFLLGLLSVLAVVHVGLSFIGGAAALCSLVALGRISASPSETSGRALAVAGLVLAVFTTAVGVAREVTEQRLADIHSRKLAVQWCEYLKQGQPHKAYELERSGTARRPLDNKLLDTYLSSESEYESLEDFVKKPEVLALLTLGEQAQVRHYRCLAADSEYANQVYAVTYSDEGVKKSFLVQIDLARSLLPVFGSSAWRIYGTEGPWDPDES